AAQMNIPLNELYSILQDMHGLTITNLDEPDETTGLTAADLVCDTGASPFQQFEDAERRRALAEAIDKLPERERQVVALYYLEELTMKEIGEVLSVTESRVSQMHTQAIVRLRVNLPK
ncbi:MAG: sigma-70 family RNA polymerase sigma factor, partial [Pyrinomonadaceae bacterium]|nr:sigma-70 family RNA polymerase sigma factor [Pyrinomonadaceae bacterium]